jgi:DNA-binding CsgD family transcriptional regulator
VENLSGIIKRRSTPGILIFDINNRLLYSNREALEMIPDLRKTVKTGKTKKQYIPEEIYNLLNQVKTNANITNTIQGVYLNYAVLNSGSGPPCSLRAFFIGGHGEDINKTHIMVLIEKIAEKREADFEKAKRDFNLTNRESEVLRLLCYGDTNKGIAEKLFITEYTVKDHIKKIMRKIGVNSRSEVIANLR